VLFRHRQAFRLVCLKLLDKVSERTQELYDLSVDPGEKNNVADQNADIVRDLEARLLAYAKQQKMSEWLKAQPDYLGAQGQTVFDPDFDIDDGGMPHAKTVLPKR